MLELFAQARIMLMKRQAFRQGIDGLTPPAAERKHLGPVRVKLRAAPSVLVRGALAEAQRLFEAALVQCQQQAAVGEVQRFLATVSDQLDQ